MQYDLKYPAHLGPQRDADGRILPSPRFPDMNGLTDYVHGKGLKDRHGFHRMATWQLYYQWCEKAVLPSRIVFDQRTHKSGPSHAPTARASSLTYQPIVST